MACAIIPPSETSRITRVGGGITRVGAKEKRGRDAMELARLGGHYPCVQELERAHHEEYVTASSVYGKAPVFANAVFGDVLVASMRCLACVR